MACGRGARSGAKACASTCRGTFQSARAVGCCSPLASCTCRAPGIRARKRRAQCWPRWQQCTGRTPSPPPGTPRGSRKGGSGACVPPAASLSGVASREGVSMAAGAPAAEPLLREFLVVGLQAAAGGRLQPTVKYHFSTSGGGASRGQLLKTCVNFCFPVIDESGKTPWPARSVHRLPAVLHPPRASKLPDPELPLHMLHSRRLSPARCAQRVVHVYAHRGRRHTALWLLPAAPAATEHAA